MGAAPGIGKGMAVAEPAGGKAACGGTVGVRVASVMAIKH
jgi:hypothetical protein